MKLETFFESFAPLADAPNGVQKLRELILKLAVQGKLVPQDAHDEPAAVLLTKIKAEKERLIQERKIKKSEPLPPIEADEVPFDLPQGWEWVRLDDFASISTGFAFKSPDYEQSGIFVLRVTNIQSDGLINKHEAVFFPESKITPQLAKHYLSAGEILVVMVGGSLGKLGVVTPELLPALLNQNMWRINALYGECPRDFLLLALKYINGFQLKITQSTHGHLSMEEYRQQVFALPPLAEQRRIVAKVDQLMALCDELEAKLRQAQTASAKLMESAVRQLQVA